MMKTKSTIVDIKIAGAVAGKLVSAKVRREVERALEAYPDAAAGQETTVFEPRATFDAWVRLEGGDLKRIVRRKLNPGVNYFHFASMRLIGPAS
jgi:hypothetical protein